MNQTSKIHWLQRFDRYLWWFSFTLGGITLIFMTGFSTWNVLIMRKALNAPIQGAEDLLILSLVTIVALSIPLGARTGAHIEIEVLESSMSAGFAKWSAIVMKCLGAVLLVVLSWRLFHAGSQAERFGETTQQLLISYEPFYYMLAVSSALFAVVVVIDIWQLRTKGKVTKFQLRGDAL